MKEEKEITTTMQSSTAMQQSCTFAEGNCFFPVNKEEKEKKEEVEEEEKEEDNKEAEEEITTAMQSSPAVEQSCTRGPRQLFPSSEQGRGGEGGGREQAVGGG